MNTTAMKRILADSAITTRLMQCKSVRELEFCLNKEGADCTREEALRFLRTCKNLADEEEESEIATQNQVAVSSMGIIGNLLSLFRHHAHQKDTSTVRRNNKSPTVDDILARMNQQTH